MSFVFVFFLYMCLDIIDIDFLCEVEILNKFFCKIGVREGEEVLLVKVDFRDYVIVILGVVFVGFIILK